MSCLYSETYKETNVSLDNNMFPHVSIFDLKGPHNPRQSPQKVKLETHVQQAINQVVGFEV